MDDSKIKFGRELAQSVADRVQNGAEYHETHRDYCGMGLFYVDGLFVYGTVVDGWLAKRVLEFETKEKFVSWLSEQSDDSLDGKENGSFDYKNQRITRSKLGF